MNLEVPKRSHRSISTSRCLGANSPRRMAARIASVTAGFGSSGIQPLLPVAGARLNAVPRLGMPAGPARC
jgi:hypothetical protein